MLIYVNMLKMDIAVAYGRFGMSLMQKLNISRLDLNLLVVFDSMMKTRSVTAVSEALEMSQPNVSRSLKKLREFFNDELFIRAARGMQPTERALALQQPIERMIDIVRSDILDSQQFDLKSSERSFVINMTDLGELSFLPKLLKHCRQVAPKASIECVCLDSQVLLDALRDGKVDLAMGFFPELTAQTIHVQTLVKHPFICLAREGHPLTPSGLTSADYSRADHISLVGDGHAQRRFEERIARSGIERRIKLRTRNMMSIPFLVRDSDLIATVPKMLAYVCAEVGGFQVFRPPFKIDPIPISQYWTDRQHNDPAHIWLRRTIADLLQDQDPTKNVKYW